MNDQSIIKIGDKLYCDITRYDDIANMIRRMPDCEPRQMCLGDIPRLNYNALLFQNHYDDITTIVFKGKRYILAPIDHLKTYKHVRPDPRECSEKTNIPSSIWQSITDDCHIIAFRGLEKSEMTLRSKYLDVHLQLTEYKARISSLEKSEMNLRDKYENVSPLRQMLKISEYKANISVLEKSNLNLRDKYQDVHRQLTDVLTLDNAHYSNLLFEATSDPIPQDDRINDLMDKAALMFEHQFVKQVDIIPVYDYATLKARSADLHKEYRMVFKFFSKLVRIRYDLPIAIAVPK